MLPGKKPGSISYRMEDFLYILKRIMLASEVLAGVMGIIKFSKFRNSHWKWFIYYLIFIAISELLCNLVFCYVPVFRTYYYDFFVIPIEFLVLYWLYSYKSLKKKTLFWICSGIYLLSLFPYFIFGGKQLVNSFNYIVGTFLLSLMIVLEFNKQIKTDDILHFRKNMMFYINTATGIFYVGTLPFFAFQDLLAKDKVILMNYAMLFVLANITMYTLFSIALLWGKPNTY